MNNINRNVWKETEFGKIPKKWDIVSLEDISLKITDGSHSSPPSVEKGYPMASVKDMTNSGFNLLSCRHISLSDYEMLVKNGCKPIKNDVLIAKDGSYLKEIFVVKEEIEMAILSSIAIIRPDMTKINPEYLKYFLSDSRIKKMVADGYVSGSVIPRIVLKNFRKIKIVSPPLEVQAKIAQILSSFDDKIELNNAINKNLEEIAQTLFKQWFVDFEFPNENGEPYKSSGGEMVESELGLIPKGWRVGKLEDVIEFIIDNRGKTPPIIDMMEKCKYPLVEVNAVTGNSRVVNLSSIKKYVSEATYSTWFRKGHPQKGDVLISTVGTIGQLALIWDEQISIAQNLIAVRGKYDGIYTYQLIYSIIEEIKTLDISSVQPSIKVPHMMSVNCIIPDGNIVKEYINRLTSVVDKLYVNSIETQTLTKLRDELLPKLMSGEIQV